MAIVPFLAISYQRGDHPCVIITICLLNKDYFRYIGQDPRIGGPGVHGKEVHPSCNTDVGGGWIYNTCTYV